MAAGLGFKDFTTGEVLTAADVDGYLMQGVWVFASAAARDAAVTSPQEGNFAYLKDTNVTTYYTGSAWANLDTTGMTNPMTTTGDVIYSSSGSTPARLGIGSTGDVLTVAGGIPSWAAPVSGGMTLLSTTSLSGSTTTISGISGSYVNLVMFVADWDPSVDGAAAYLRLNGETGNVYSQAATVAGSTTPVLTDKFTLVDSADDTVNDGLFWVQIPYYANTATFKICQMYSIATDNGSAPRLRMHNNFGAVNTTSAISSITIYPSSGNATGTAYIYGVK